MFSYRAILRQAWTIAWKHKYLWFFGLFASLAVAGGSMEYRFFTQSLGQGLIAGSYDGLNGLLAMSDLLTAAWTGFVDLFSQNIVIILNALTLILLTFTLIAIFVWLAISSQAALVDSVRRILGTKKKPSMSIREGLTAGNKHFWSVLGLNILIKLMMSLAFFLISLPLLFLVVTDGMGFVISYTLLFIILVPVAVSLSLIIKYAIAGRVIDDLPLMGSLERGYNIFKKNWLVSIEVALLLFIISFAASLAFLIVVSIIFLPLLWLSLLFAWNFVVFLILFLILLATALFGSLLTTFQVTSWTDLYLQLQAGRGRAKLERVFKKS